MDGHMPYVPSMSLGLTDYHEATTTDPRLVDPLHSERIMNLHTTHLFLLTLSAVIQIFDMSEQLL